MKLLTILLALFACKPMHRQESATKYAVSDSGILLTAVSGNKDMGICMLQSSRHHPDEQPRLLTVDGSISSNQLKKAVRFLGYGEQIVVPILAGLIGIGLGATAPTVAAATAVSLGVTSAGVVGYTVIRGNVEKEKASPIALRTLLAGATVAPISEYFHRTGRRDTVLSDTKKWEITDGKMRKLVERIRDIVPDFSGSCDHLKSTSDD